MLEVDNAKFPNLIKKSAELFRKNKKYIISLPELKLLILLNLYLSSQSVPICTYFLCF